MKSFVGGSKLARRSVSLTVAVAVFSVGLSAAFGWDFQDNLPDDEKTCAKVNEREFQADQPRIYLSLDRSGSMGREIEQNQCNACDFSYLQGTELSTQGVDWSSSGASRTVNFPDITPKVDNTNEKTKLYTSDGQDLSFHFAHLTANGDAQIPVTVEAWGDFDAGTEFGTVSLTDGSGPARTVGSFCNVPGDCNQCESSANSKTFMVPASEISDGEFRMEVELSSAVDADSWCSDPKQVRVSIPSEYFVEIRGETQQYTYDGQDFSFDFSNVKTNGESTVPVTVEVWGDYNGGHEHAEVTPTNASSPPAEICEVDDQCAQCGPSPDSETFEVPATEISAGTMNLDIDVDYDVGEFCGENKVRVTIPDRYFSKGSFPQSACLGAKFELWGDYGSNSGNDEYADITLSSPNETTQPGDICKTESACSDCTGPHTGQFEVTSTMKADGELYATMQNSPDVEGSSYCSENRAEISLVEYTSGDPTISGSFDCPYCTDDADCRAELNAPDCAITNASHKTVACSKDKTKWEIAVDSIDAALQDLVEQSDPDAAEFGLGLFNTGAWNEESIEEDNYKDILQDLNSQYPNGGTDLYDAIRNSRNELNSSRLEAGILITDGKQNDDPSEVDVINEACEHRDNNGDLYVIGFGGGTDEEYNDVVAAAGGSGACCTSTGAGETCTKSHSNYIDVCDDSQVSDSDLWNNDAGRDYDCSGAYQANNGTGLKNAINSITGDLSCNIDVSNLPGKWQDSYYGCKPHYNCFKVYLPGSKERIFHENSSRTPRGWSWVNPAEQDYVSLNPKYCDKVKNKLTKDKRVRVTRACMCDKPKGAECDYPLAKTCTCEKGNWACNQGFDECSQKDFSECAPSNLKGHQSGTCAAGYGVCRETGEYVCTAPQTLECSASADTSQKSPEVCDGVDNDCDGSVDEDQNGNALTQTCDTGKPGRCAAGTRTCANGSYGSCIQNKMPISETCNGIDDDCDGEVDEVGVQSCDTGGTGRCSVGYRECRNGSWTNTCFQKYRAVPEICNGLDEDCDGVIDNIMESWRKQKFSSVTADVDADGAAGDPYMDGETGYSVSASIGTQKACGMNGSCQCQGADARDDTYRPVYDPTQTAPGTSKYSTADREYDEMVADTVQQNGTSCSCSE